MVSEDERLLVLLDTELWQGVKAPFPFNFDFGRIATVGCIAPYSVTKGPPGTFFLGNDLKPYIVPRGGTPQAIGHSAHRFLRESISSANDTTVCGVYWEEQEAYVLTWQLGQVGAGAVIPLRGKGYSALAFQNIIYALGSTYAEGIAPKVALSSGSIGRQRILAVQGGGTVNEWLASATSDNGSKITCQFSTVIPNPNPTERQFVRELRLDYRAASPSTLSLQVQTTADFGKTYSSSTVLSLVSAADSAQARVAVGQGGVYVGVNISHASGQTFTIQGLHAIVESAGNG
jgi:hypothetical protein